VEKATCRAVLAEMLAMDGTPLGKALISRAQESGAWFYWSFACRLAVRQIEQQYGVGCLDNGGESEADIRATYRQIRRKKVEALIKQRLS
jgi:hypothetical protein